MVNILIDDLPMLDDQSLSSNRIEVNRELNQKE